MPRIFLSHSHKDKTTAMKIKEVIESIGLSVWIDDYEMGIGDSLARKIAEGIGRCDYLIIIISKNSETSGWVQKELDWAITKEIKDSSFKVLPLILDRTKLPDILSDKLYFQLTQNYSQLGLKIARTILNDTLVEQLPTERVLSNFEIFNATKENLKAAYFAIFIGALVIVFSFYFRDWFLLIFIFGSSIIGLGFYINYIFSKELKILKSNRDLVKRLEKIGPFKLPFGKKWSEQKLIADEDCEFSEVFYGETFVMLISLGFIIITLILMAFLSKNFQL